MLVVSTRDFRTNQTKYLNKANAGEHVILKSRTAMLLCPSLIQTVRRIFCIRASKQSCRFCFQPWCGLLL